MKKFLTIAASIVALLAILISAIVFYIQGPPVIQGKTDLKFKEVEFSYEHKADLENALPFMGLATVDLDGDGVDEIFVGSGSGQADELFRFDGSGFSLIPTPGTFTKGSNETTFGAASIDTTGDGLDELFVARDSGVYYYQNLGSNKFAEQRIDFGLEDNTIPLSIALGDINLDGWVDLYISGYIKPELVEGETNFDPTYGGYSHLLLNKGNNSWQQITKPAGLFRQHNTFLAMFIDLNNDEWPDLVVAQDTGVVEIWRNLGDLTFNREETPTAYGYPMGIGAGDINNDGLVDLYLSNVGNTVPGAMLRGNLAEGLPFNTDYMLLKNDGDFKFSDISEQSNAAKYGFGWGVTITDFTNDGKMDLYFSQNYVRFPGVDILLPYPGRLLQQYPDGGFQAVETTSGLANKNFGITQVVSDFNQDGWPDIVLANLNGPMRAFLNQGGDRHSLTVHLPDGPAWLNTRVTVTKADGSKLTRQLFASEGLCSDSTDALFFGLGTFNGAVKVDVHGPGGETKSYANVSVDSILKVSK